MLNAKAAKEYMGEMGWEIVKTTAGIVRNSSEADETIWRKFLLKVYNRDPRRTFKDLHSEALRILKEREAHGCAR